MGDETPTNLPAPAPTGGLKKKKDEKYRKRDPRSWENIMRTTANMSLEEKQQYLENIYNEMYIENRASNANLQARDKQYTQCLKEHEKDRAELTKSILARGQLESLCRELQKQNKLIKVRILLYWCCFYCCFHYFIDVMLSALNCFQVNLYILALFSLY